MKRRIPRWAKIIGWIVAIFVTALATICIVGVATEQIGAHSDQQLFERAAQDIHLPSRYKLVDSIFVQPHSIDISSYTQLRYRTTDGRKADLQEVIDALNRSTYTHIDSYWKKNYDAKDVYVLLDVSDSPNEVLFRLARGL